MKKSIAVMAVLIMALAITGCSGKSSQEGDTTSSLDLVPLLIDRQILTDAVWGEGTDVPENVACVAGSQITFKELVNPLTIMKNSGANGLNVTPAVITTSINIYINENDGENRAESCPEGDLYYIVSASEETAIDIEAIGENCPDLAEIAAEEATAFPSTGSVVAHFEPYEVALDVVDLSKDEASEEETVEEETEETTDDETDTIDPNKIPQKMFKLVIDQCDA
jgi:hypothetical protein